MRSAMALILESKKRGKADHREPTNAEIHKAYVLAWEQADAIRAEESAEIIAE